MPHKRYFIFNFKFSNTCFQKGHLNLADLCIVSFVHLWKLFDFYIVKYLTFYVILCSVYFILGKCEDNKCTHNGILKRGKYIESASKNHRLILSSEGNLEIYCGSKVVWSEGNNNADYLYFNSKGDLVLYNKNKDQVWSASNMWNRKSTPNVLLMQEDGNLVLYDECGSPYWESKTYDKCKPGSG